MFRERCKSVVAILVAGCTLATASLINHSAVNTSSVAHFFNECQTFSIGATFNGIADGQNRALSVEGNCEDERKTVVCSYMWLNRCYNNVNGQLEPANGDGNFANTCKHCRANDPLRAGWLFCDCAMTTEIGSVMVPAEANMQNHLYVNSAGALSCNGNEGHLCRDDGSPEVCPQLSPHPTCTLH